MSEKKHISQVLYVMSIAMSVLISYTFAKRVVQKQWNIFLFMPRARQTQIKKTIKTIKQEKVEDLNCKNDIN